MHKKITTLTVVRVILLAVFGLAMLFPFAWMIATSFKQGRDVFNLSLIPKKVSVANYQKLFSSSRFPRWFMNSILSGVIVCGAVLFFDSLVGYTFAKFQFNGKKLFFVMILSTMMIPTEMLVIPWFIMSNRLHWVDTYWGIVFPGLMSGFGTFLMRQFFSGLPDDLLDAGRIDGLNEFKIWGKIGMPLVTSAISALLIFTFIGNWNAYLWPLIICNQMNMYTLPVGLSFFNGEFQTDWAMVMTGASVATIPVLILYLFFQHQIIMGITLTGVKG